MTTDNPYSPPAAPVSQTPRASHRLYSPAQIALATFIGTVAAGAWLLARNFSAFDQQRARDTTLTLGIVAAIAYVVVVYVFFFASSQLLISIAFAVAIYLLAKTLQDRAINQALADGAELHSTWRAAGLGLLFAVALTLLVAAAMLVVSVLLVG